uniref:Uncharacterized protein n=1 Tax=Oryza barthii TaxID=65489 RepID=A0A0D3F2B4_9ORYZ
MLFFGSGVARLRHALLQLDRGAGNGVHAVLLLSSRQDGRGFRKPHQVGVGFIISVYCSQYHTGAEERAAMPCRSRRRARRRCAVPLGRRGREPLVARMETKALSKSASTWWRWDAANTNFPLAPMLPGLLPTDTGQYKRLINGVGRSIGSSVIEQTAVSAAQ